METKKCSKCGEIKSIIEFHKCKVARDGHYIWCKKCVNETSREWRKNNRKRVVAWRKNNRGVQKRANKKWRENNPEKHEAANKKWKEKNPDKLMIIRKKTYRKRWKISQNRLNGNISSGIWRSLRGKGGSKNGDHWEKITGYTLRELIKHLEKQFKKGITWNNYGKWHVDHIRPVSSFSFSSYEDKEFKECWALNNLQPLWAEENLKKGAKICQSI